MSYYIVDVKTPAHEIAGAVKSEYGLENHGLKHLNNVYWNLPTEALYEEIIFRREGRLSSLGPVVVSSGNHTDCAANDKFIVQEPMSEDKIWWGTYNRPFSQEKFSSILHRLLGFMQKRDVFVQDCYGGADPNYRLPVRIISEYAWHSLFARNILIPAESNDLLRKFVPEFTIMTVPSFKGVPEIEATLSETFILINFDMKMAVIGNTGFGGEIKSTIFTILNYLLPLENILTMRCAANVGSNGDAALFFGLPGTGKTTLAADPDRRFLGSDEHGWSDNGIFNFEGGCYSRVLNLSPDTESQLFACTQKFGTILENAVCDPVSRKLDVNDERMIENARAAFPLHCIDNAIPEKVAGHPRDIFVLTCDTSGVLPPIAKLTPEQAAYHFISGYTSKVGGNESDLDREPEVTFSACFGAQYMVHHPCYYAERLRNKILKHNVNCWLINTGWSGGPYGVGEKISAEHTRTLLKAVHDGKLLEAEYRKDPVFGFEIPKHCEGVPEKILYPPEAWSDRKACKDKYLQLASLYIDNFRKFSEGCPPEIIEAGPKKADFQL